MWEDEISNNNNIEHKRLYKDIPQWLKIIRKIHFLLNLPYKRIWWLTKPIKNDKQNYDAVILFDSAFYLKEYSRFIEKNISAKKYILFYWNPIWFTCVPNKISDHWEKWSFDKYDAKSFNIRYNGTFFVESYLSKFNKTKTIQDLFFIGKDKGRYNDIKTLESNFYNLGLKTEFLIINDRPLNFLSKHQYSKPISYDKVLAQISKSRMLLDYNQKNQSGLTLRVMESIFLQKKLLTSNSKIIEYEFYNPNNIFIISEDKKLSHLNDFIRTPFNPIKKEILEEYMFSNWLYRIVNGIESNQ
jgi:hypothetical protein